MASEALEKAGLHFDDLNRIRVLDEDTSSQVFTVNYWLHAGLDYNLLHLGSGTEGGLSGLSGGHRRLSGVLLQLWHRLLTY